MKSDEWMDDGRMDEWMYKWIDTLMVGLMQVEEMNGCMVGTNGLVDGCMD